jgi:hypothetical protein
MPVSFTSLRQRRWLASLLVVAYVLRALIPGGFMPGAHGALTLQICPEGFPTALLSHAGEHEAHAAHHHVLADTDERTDALSTHSSGSPTHDHKSWMLGHCAFGAAAGAPPLCTSSIVAVVVQSGDSQTHVATVPASLDFRFRIAQPRGPPSLT